MKKITFAFIAFISVVQLSAQWNQISYMAIGPDTANNINMYAGFGANLYSATNKGVFISTNNGNNWTSLTYATPVTQSLTMLSVWEESVTTLYAGSDKRLYKSTNSGSSWTWIPLSIDSINVNEIQRSNTNLVLSYSKNFNKGGAFFSTNNGLSWSQSSGIPAANPMYDMHVEGDTVYIAGTGGIYRSVDMGANFSFLGNGTNVGLRTITRHQGKLFAGDGGGTGLYVSSNGGVTWTAANASIFAGFCQVFSAAQAPSMIIAVVDGGSTCNNSSSNPVKASTDGGATWATYTVGLVMPGSYTKVGTNSALTSFFTSKGNKIFRTNGAAGVKEISSADNATIYFDANKELNISVANSTNITARVFSVNGSLLYQNDFSENELKIKELVNLQPGVYLVMLNSGNMVITKKVYKQD